MVRKKEEILGCMSDILYVVCSIVTLFVFSRSLFVWQRKKRRTLSSNVNDTSRINKPEIRRHKFSIEH